MMPQHHARDILSLSQEALWEFPPEQHQIVFTDGTVTSHTRRTILSFQLCQLLKHYPEVPLRSCYHFGDRKWNAKLMLAVLNNIRQDIDDFYQGQLDRELLRRRVFDTANDFYNNVITHTADSVMGLSMFDLLDLLDNPSIRDTLLKVQPTQYAIEDVVYPGLKKILMDDPGLDNNPLAISVRAGTIRMEQLLQCIGPRGFLTDINSEIFQEPITASYAEGIYDLYGSMIESRSATKALVFNKLLLRGTEYFNRKVQLVSQYVQWARAGDCGTPHTIPFEITSAKWLDRLKGKYVYVEGSARPIAITGNEQELIGTTVNMRSVLGCIHPEPGAVCEVCYGRLFESIPEGTNIGQVGAVASGDKITSAVLSTKHLDSSSRVEQFQLHKVEARYLTKDPKNETLYLKPRLGKYVTLTVLAKEVSSLSDAIIASELSELSVTSTTELTRIRLQVDDNASDVLTVSLFNRKASFTYELLEHIRKVKWSHDANGNYVIDLSLFDPKKPLLALPFKHVNMFENMRHIESYLHSTSDDDTRLARKDERMRNQQQYNHKLIHSESTAQALFTFAVMLNEKLNINIVHCEVLLYAMMVRSVSDRDYRLPKPAIHGEFASYSDIMRNRSLSAVMALENQARVLASPTIFNNTDINDHPYDMICLGGNMK